MLYKIGLPAWMLICAGYVWACLTGCSSLTSALNPTVVQAGKVNAYIRQDLYVKVDSTAAVLGTAVVPFKPSFTYHIFIASAAKLDVVFIENCNRSWPVYATDGKVKKYSSASGEGWSYEFDYEMVAENEKVSCPLSISTLEIAGRRKSYATIAFQNPAFTLAGDLRCNGRRVSPSGVGLCQAKQGKLQELHFQQKVKMFSPGKECPLPPKGDLGSDFEFSLPVGACTYGFDTYDPPFKHMIFHTVGYAEDEYPEEVQ